MQKNNDVSKSIGLLNAMRTVDESLDTSSWCIFLLVCEKEGISNDDIVKRYQNFHKARISRGIHVLCKTSRCRLGQDGAGLLVQKIDPNDFRKRSLYLTNKGIHVRDKLSKLLG
mgnify:CR=1 FL=1